MEDKLVVAVTAHPVLYDTSCLLYRDRYKKEQAWSKVSEVAGLPVDVCRRRWKSLRDTYMRERRKGTESRSGAAAGTVKKWKYFAVLSFLDPFVAPRETSGNMGAGVEEDGAVEYSVGSMEDEGETAGPSGITIGAQADSDIEPESAGAPPDDGPAVSPAAVSAASPAASVPRATKRARKRAREEEDSADSTNTRAELEALVLDTLNGLKQRAQPAPQPPPSEDELFLKSLVPSLERLSPQKKAFVTFQIHKLIYEASTVVLYLEPAE
ncbi:transcription factor Adf-1-like [Scomber japonicus]|uniref:transcription factor Adf-1-like n=1 Tax=Scomber japonicus TaxID=13676 RepID=UPI002305D214|nr:transcription factor Adf-1-like [Scomber japonicus]